MNKNCVGCGITLQCEEPFEDGYVNPSLFGETLLCRRCFRLKHYGEYKVTNKSSSYYKNIIKDIFNSFLYNNYIIYFSYYMEFC